MAKEKEGISQKEADKQRVEQMKQAKLAAQTSDALKKQAALKDVEIAREEQDRHFKAVEEQAKLAAASVETPSQADFRKHFAEYEKRNPVKAKLKRESGEFDRKLAALKK